MLRGYENINFELCEDDFEWIGPFSKALRDSLTTSWELIRYPAAGLELICALLLKFVLVYPGHTPKTLIPFSLYSS